MPLRLRLKSKTNIAITLLIIGVATILSMFFTRKVKDIIDSSLRQRGMTLASTLAYNAEYGVLTNNEKALLNLIEGVMKQSDVVYCYITNEKSEIIAQKGLDGFIASSSEFLDIENDLLKRSDVVKFSDSRGGDFYDLVFPVFTEEFEFSTDETSLFSENDLSILLPTDRKGHGSIKQIGSIHLGLSLKGMKQLTQHSQEIAIIITLSIIVVSIIFSTFVTGIAIRPITKLAELSHRVADGDLSVKVDVATHDEIGELAASFNKMIGDLKKSRDELIHAKEYTDNIIRSMVDLLVVVGPKGRIRMVNPALLNQLGFNERELLGKDIDSIFDIQGRDSGKPRSNITRALLRRGFISDYEMEYRKKDGDVVPVLFSGAVMRDSKGGFEGIVGIAKDITERKQAQLIIEDKNKELEEANKQLIAKEKLERMNRELQAKYDVQREFSSTISHELRSPLASIKLALDIVLSGTTGELSDNQKDFLTKAKVSVDRLKRLINEILDLSKLESGKITLKKEKNNINNIIQEVVEIQAPVAEDKNLYLRMDLDKNISELEFDSDKIIQVLNNIVVNSLKFTDDGGVTVETKHFKDEGYLRIAVRDTGEGIKEDDMKKLFQKFQQLGDPATRKTGGTGLGLAICKEIIEQHGGKIWAESEFQKGSTFYFTLLLGNG